MGLFDRFRRSTPDATVAPALRYRAADFTTVPLGGERVLLYKRSSGAPARIVAEFAVDALRRCAAFKTIEEHAEQLGPDAAGIAALEAELKSFVDGGFLVTETSASAEKAVKRIDKIGMLTRSRDDCARRCVESIVSAAEHFDRRRELTIGDDDATGDRAARIPMLVPRRSAAVTLRYVGRPEKKTYAERLASESGVEPALVEYALLGPSGSNYTAGANHNALLLDAIGDRILTVDDDTCGRMTRVPGIEGPTAELRSGAETTKLWLYPDVEAAIAAAHFEDVDPLAIHEAALGTSLGEALGRAAGDGDLHIAGASPKLYDDLERGTVGITSVGLCGDSGMSSPSYYLFLKGDAQARLFEDYARLRTTRAMIRATPGLLITDGQYLMTPHTGFDLGTIVPPYHPVGRNADGILGTMLRSVSPHRYIAHLPWAVEHRPELRSYPETGLHEGPSRLGFPDILLSCVQACAHPPGATSTESRLRFMGEHLIGIADLPALERDEWLRHRRFQQLSRTTTGLTTILDQGKGPPEYLADVEQALKATEAAITSTTLIQALDFPPDRQGLVPELLRRYGQLLVAWPEIWRAGVRLAASGVRVSAPVESGI